MIYVLWPLVGIFCFVICRAMAVKMHNESVWRLARTPDKSICDVTLAVLAGAIISLLAGPIMILVALAGLVTFCADVVRWDTLLFNVCFWKKDDTK